MTEMLERLIESGVYIGKDGTFAFTSNAERILPLTAGTIEQAKMRRELIQVGHKYKSVVDILSELPDLTPPIRRIMKLKAPLYNRLVRGLNSRIWIPQDLSDLQDIMCDEDAIKGRATQALKASKITLAEFMLIGKFLKEDYFNCGLIAMYKHIKDEHKGSVQRALFDQSFRNREEKYEYVRIYCLLKPVGKKWEVIHAEYPSGACAGNHIGRIKLTHGLCFF